jgi:hypothetical protein
MKQDIFDFRDKRSYATPGVWIQRCREAGYPELTMEYNSSLRNIIEWHAKTATRLNCLVFKVGPYHDRHFFFNTEQDKVLFILKWS